MKRFLSLILALVCLLSALPLPQARAAEAFAYDPEAAVSYAVANWDNNDGTVCDQFVKNCLDAGGVTVRPGKDGDVSVLADALVSAGFGTRIEVKTDEDNYHINKADNPSLAAGDPLFYYCPTCVTTPHTVLITGFDEEGNAYCHGHNPSWNAQDWFGTFKHTGKMDYEHSGFTFYAVHMDTSTKDHKHTFEQGYDQPHPHNMYDKCSICGASYYLGWGATVTSCEICNPPLDTVPVVSGGYADGKVSLSWSTVAGATGYHVYRATVKNGTYWLLTEDNMLIATKFTTSNVEPGVTYYFRVDAVLSDGSAAPSEIFTVTIPGDAAAPVLSAKDHESGKPSMEWTRVPGAVKYEVQRAVKGGSYAEVTTTDSLSYTNTGAVGGTTYVYRVRAIMEDGSKGDFSNTVTFEVKSESITLTKRDHEDGKPSMEWNKIMGATKYEVHKAVKGKEFEIAITTEKSSYTNTGAVGNTTYEFKVRAIMEDGTKGEFSNTVTFDVPADVITLSKKSRPDGKPSMKWNQVFGAAGYEVVRTDLSTGAVTSYEIEASSLSFSNPGAVGGITYEYKVRAVMKDGSKGEYSNTLTFEVEGTEVGTPFLKAYTRRDNGKPRITWDKIDGAVKYEVYRAPKGSNEYKRMITTAKNYSIHSGAEVGKAYSYKVRAVAEDGSVSAFSNVKTLWCYPKRPTLTSDPLASGKPNMTWTESEGADGYLVYYRVKGTSTFKKLIQRNGADYTHVNHTGAAAGKTYEYRVRAFTKAADGTYLYSNYSSIKAITCKTVKPEVSPRTISSGKPSIEWEKVQGADGYVIYVREPGGSFRKLHQKTGTYLNHTGAVSGKTYEYRIRAFSKNGAGKFVYSSYSNIVSIKSK